MLGPRVPICLFFCLDCLSAALRPRASRREMMLRRTPARALAAGAQAESELNLVPIMNLVVCLIPMVLFGASFVDLGVVNASTPKFGDVRPVPPNTPEPVKVTVGLSHAGIAIKSDHALPGVAPGEAIEIPRLGDRLDLTRFYNHMVQIRDAHEAVAPLILTADERVPYAEVIRVMDAARHRLEASSYAEDEAFRSARRLRGPEGLLWPDVSLGRAH